MARRYWIYRSSDGERIAGPLETEPAAATCVRALESETGGEYEYRPHP